MAIDWAAVRAEFPALTKYTYLSTAGGGPMARATRDAAVRYYDESVSDGDRSWNEWLRRVEATRARVARFLNADPSALAFVQNTSHAMNLLAQWRQGTGAVLAMDDDFPTATIPFLNRGYQVEFLAADEQCRITPECFAAALTPGIRTAVVSTVQYATGFRLNLAACAQRCRERNVMLIADASQSICALPLDVQALNLDCLVCSCNKWGLSGYGIGLLYIRPGLLDGRPLPAASWMSVTHPPAMDNRSTDFKTGVVAVEGGGPSFPNIFAFGATVALVERIGMIAIAARIDELTEYLRSRLDACGCRIVSPRTPEARAGITIIDLPEKERVAAALAERGILVSVRRRGIRVAVNFYNSHADIDILIAALQQCAGN
ncbi:MAG TPA: aminotransferase class V-fold PLP-dependent enzyme [bacterium]|nr:aminotransferase class V-fold PLP-dependent enzyme [bacterium]